MEIRDIGSFLEYFDKVHGRTNQVIQSIPTDKFDWTYREGKFTFADLIRHMAAIERYMFAETVQNRRSAYPGHGTDLADGPESVIAFFNRMHEESVAIFGTLTSDDLTKKCETPGGARITVWKWLRNMVEHEIHHRGELYAYLGVLGLEAPPMYGMTSEQVREKSTPAIPE